MFACVFFPGDHTLSVVNENSKALQCENFVKGGDCIVKFKGQPWKGTIVHIGENQSAVKDLMHQLLKDVLTEPCEEPLKLLLEYVVDEKKKKDKDGPKNDALSQAKVKTPTKKEQRKKTPTKKESSLSKKPLSNPKKVVTSQNLPELPGTSLMETWHIINEKDKEFTPSTELVSILKKLSTPSISAEIKDMLRYFESKEQKNYTDIGEDITSYTTSTANTYLDLPYTVSHPQHSSITPSHFQQQPYSEHFLTTPSQHTGPTGTSLNQSIAEYTASPFLYTQDYGSQTTQQQAFNLTPNTNSFNTCLQSPTQQQSGFNHTTNTNHHVLQNPVGHSDFSQTPNTTPSLFNQSQKKTDTIENPPHQTPNTTPNMAQTPTMNTNSQSTEIRRSPRKRLVMSQEPLVTTPDENVTLMGNVRIPRKILRAARNMASKNDRPAFTLMSKLLTGVFSTAELANSRGLGLAPVKAADTRPALDKEKIKACKEYVIGWCLDQHKVTPQDKDLNEAVTEQCSYARKKIKRSMAQKN